MHTRAHTDGTGATRWDALGPAFLGGADAVLVCVDVARPASVATGTRWVAELRARAVPGPGSGMLAVVGNVADTGAPAAEEEEEAVRQTCEADGVPFFAVCSATGAGVDALLAALVCDAMTRTNENHGLQVVHRSHSGTCTVC